MPSLATISTLTDGYHQTIVQLKELDCQGCADNIRGMVWNCDGVESVVADVKTKLVKVVYDYPFTEESLIQVLTRAHFEIAEQVTPQMEVVEAEPQAIPA